jgi:hypothetical protein
MFGDGRRIPLDRNAKARLIVKAHWLQHHMPDGSRESSGD